MIIFETDAAKKRQTLSKQDIKDILNFRGTEQDACDQLMITREQYQYVIRNYDSAGRHTFREDMTTLHYE